MPKIIENVREQLLETAKDQLLSQGYSKTTIRSVAGACGLGVGTVYNYFKSKDMLIATFMLEDWLECLKEMERFSSDDSEAVLERIFLSLQSFIQKYQALFSDINAAKVFATVFSERHKQLRGQLAKVIRPICNSSSTDNPDFLAEFMAESLLTWTVENKSFEELSAIFKLILK